jgi:hypothetical protein
VKFTTPSKRLGCSPKKAKCMKIASRTNQPTNKQTNKQTNKRTYIHTLKYGCAYSTLLASSLESEFSF